jgi:hypothetical protein
VEHRDPDHALALLDDAVGHAERVDNRWIRAFALTESLWIRAERAPTASNVVQYRDVIDTWFRGGDWANLWLSLRNVFALLERLGCDDAAAVLYGALERAGVMQALPLEPGVGVEFERAKEGLAWRVDDGAFADAVARGRALRDEEVVRFALRTLDTIAPAG